MGDFKSKYTGPQIEAVLDHAANITTLTIKDTYPTLSALKADFPTGNEYTYQVSADMNAYIWSTNVTDWVSIGQIQGPAGAPGAKGTDGKSAYQAAKDGGYTGTEAEFNTILATAQSQIGKLSNLPTTEKSNLVGALTEVNTSLSAEITNRQNAVSNEATARANADSLKANISSPNFTGNPTVSSNMIYHTGNITVSPTAPTATLSNGAMHNVY